MLLHHLRRRWRPLLLVAVVLLTLGALSSQMLRAEAATTYSVTTTGERYGSGGTQKVTLSRPSAKGRRPTVYFIHGGGWVAGGRSEFAAQATSWATHGWVAVNLDYTRGAGPGDGAKMLADVTSVVTRYEAAPYVDRSRQIIVGDSAGGHLATTIGAKMNGHFRGVIAWSPVASPFNAYTDGAEPGASAEMQSLGQRAKLFFGYSFGTTSAYRYVQKYHGPPMWIAGTTDEWVTWSRQGGDLCDALLAIDKRLCSENLISAPSHAANLRADHPELEATAYAWAMHQIGAWK